MLHKDYVCRGSVEKETLVMSLEAWLQDELLGGKLPFLK
jgi:hypothetical protein